MGHDALAKFDAVCRIVDKYQRNESKLIPILQEVQEEYSYLPEEIMVFIATALQISPARVYGVATFFSHFTLHPKGKYVIKICDGTACHVKRSTAIIAALEEKLGLSEKNNTSADLLFTLETVSCLGACGLAPVVVINEKVHGLITPESAVALIDEIIAREKDGVIANEKKEVENHEASA